MSNNTTFGYTCPICGQFVGFHQMHSCVGPHNHVIRISPSTTVTIQPTAGELLIAAALSRIAAALEELAVAASVSAGESRQETT